MMKVIVLLAASALTTPNALVQTSHSHRHVSNATLDINQKVYIDGAEVVSSANDAQLGQCVSLAQSTVQDTARPKITVCGTGIQIQVNLRNRCEDYWTYQHTLGP